MDGAHALYSAGRGYLVNFTEEEWPASQAAVSARDALSNTPLHLAAGGNHVDVVQFLLSKGADINAVNSVGDTPLHKASFRGNGAVVKVLLDAGADTTAKNTSGRTARGLASDEEVIAQLPEDSDGGDAPDIGDDAEGDLVLEEGSEEDEDDEDDGDVEYDVEDDLS